MSEQLQQPNPQQPTIVRATPQSVNAQIASLRQRMAQNNGIVKGRTKEDILKARVALAGELSHTRETIVPLPKSHCQDRLRIAKFISSLVPTVPMPDKLRNARIRAGIPVPDPNIPYVVKNGENPTNLNTGE